MDKVTMYSRGYEWVCPVCGETTLEDDPWNVVECENCKTEFEVNEELGG